MHYFCTLFDSTYLTRGLAMIRSLRDTGIEFRIYVYCFDDLTYEVLTALGLPGVVPVAMAEFETPDLLAVKPTRSRGEYCWTSTSHVILFTLERYGVDAVTYLDADLYFFKSPQALLDEFAASNGSVLITEHRYTPRYDRSRDCGIYCVQFITFGNDERGRKVLGWWRDRCLEWCYDRREDGKFGDQKYLDDWTVRFDGVHVLQHLGGGVAPWNVQQYAVGDGPTVNGVPVVFYHFHYLAWHFDDSFYLGPYDLPDQAVELLYRPYVAELKRQLSAVQALIPDFMGGKREPAKRKRPFWKRIGHRIKGKHRVIQG